MMASAIPKVDILKSFQQKLFVSGSKSRKQFGLLERPSLPPSVPQVSFKIYVCGHCNSGKTQFIRKLAGIEGGNRYIETLGIEVTHVYWPMKVGTQLKLFRIELWDAGESSSKRYNHIKSACTKDVDGVLICFSVTSKEQWEELPQLVFSAAQPSEKAALMVIATRLDRANEAVVSEAEIRNFESSHEVPVLRKLPQHPSEDATASVAPMLNFICRQLWQRDQKLLLSASKEKA